MRLVQHCYNARHFAASDVAFLFLKAAIYFDVADGRRNKSADTFLLSLRRKLLPLFQLEPVNTVRATR